MVPRSWTDHGPCIHEEKDGRTPKEGQRSREVDQMFNWVHGQPTPRTWVVACMVDLVHALVEELPRVDAHPILKPRMHDAMSTPEVQVAPVGSTSDVPQAPNGLFQQARHALGDNSRGPIRYSHDLDQRSEACPTHGQCCVAAHFITHHPFFVKFIFCWECPV